MLKRNGFGISVDTLKGKKKPQLFIYSEEANMHVPVATFKNQKSADAFMLLLVDGMLDGMIDKDGVQCPFYQDICDGNEDKEICEKHHNSCEAYRNTINDIIKNEFK